MRRYAWIGLVVAALTGCGPEVEPPVEDVVRFVTCDRAGPVELLRVGGLSQSTVQRHGDELLVNTDVGTWLVGPCGGNARRVAESVFVESRHGTLIGCRPADGGKAPGDLLRFDPAGEAPPQLMFSNVDCNTLLTDHGWLARRDSGELLIERDLSDGEPAEVLPTTATGLPWACSPLTSLCGSGFPVLSGPDLYVTDLEGRAQRVELRPGGSAERFEDAAWARQLLDGQTPLWGGPGPDGDTVYWRNLRLGTDRVLYAGRSPRLDARERRYGLTGQDRRQLLDLRDGSMHELPEAILSIGTRGEQGPILLWGEGSWAWSETELQAVELGLGQPFCPAEWGPEGFDHVLCDEVGDELWSTPYEGGAPRHVATGVETSHFHHAAGRVVWSTGRREWPSLPDGEPSWYPSNWIGELRVATDPETSVLLDRDALMLWSLGLGLDGDVLYLTYDDQDGEDEVVLWRTGTTQRAD